MPRHFSPTFAPRLSNELPTLYTPHECSSFHSYVYTDLSYLPVRCESPQALRLQKLVLLDESLCFWTMARGHARNYPHGCIYDHGYSPTRLVINPIFSQLESKVGLPDLPTKSIKYVDLVLK
jgi:hypothetical protein